MSYVMFLCGHPVYLLMTYSYNNISCSRYTVLCETILDSAEIERLHQGGIFFHYTFFAFQW